TQDAIEKYWTRDEYEHALTDERFQFQKLLYASDGLSVVAYVLGPVGATTPLPTIVFNRGSGAHKDIAPVLMPYMHRLAQEGYLVIAPMYRQTDGGEGIDANGGDDLNDLLNILPVIRALPYADENNIFMTGESRGATMVYQAIRENFPMRAAAVWGGFTDLQVLLEQQPMMVEYAKQNWPGFGDDLQASVERRSAIYWPESFGIPVLLMHGESDGSIAVSQTLDLAGKLQQAGKLYGLIVFADDNHILHRSQLERDRASLNWFRKFDAQAAAEQQQFLQTTATERDITDRGYSLLRRGRNDEAVEVFQIGVQRFPESTNAHDSLGEALAQSGDVTGALGSYEKALDLADSDSERTRIRNILAELKSRQ
ncbi:MAG: prolyl oligopeptidase family serine peptidase, partial [Gammaproteobacteria bacterium]|nr:prolyl oligopeptidase family serine peptidase [Gammaproteobacteria bacterium]